MRLLVRGVLARLRVALHLDDPPWRIALALAIGVFISCTPFYGFQTLLTLLVATVFRLNKAVTVTGAWINLPWFAPLVYAAELKVGALLLPEVEGIGGWSLALLVGTGIIGVTAAVLTYLIALAAITRRRGRRAAVERAGSDRPLA